MDAVREQLAQANDLTLRGCYRCLTEARDLYDDLARQGFETDEAAAGLLRTTLLIGMREREMGLPGGGTFERSAALAGLDVSVAGEAAQAREAAAGGESPAAREAGDAREAEPPGRPRPRPAGPRKAGRPRPPGGAAPAGPAWETFLQVAATTPWQDTGVPKDPGRGERLRRAIADRDRDAWNAVLQPLVPTTRLPPTCISA